VEHLIVERICGVLVIIGCVFLNLNHYLIFLYFL